MGGQTDPATRRGTTRASTASLALHTPHEGKHLENGYLSTLLQVYCYSLA